MLGGWLGNNLVFFIFVVCWEEKSLDGVVFFVGVGWIVVGGIYLCLKFWFLILMFLIFIIIIID